MLSLISNDTKCILKKTLIGYGHLTKLTPTSDMEPGAVLEGFLRFPETTQDLSLDDGYTPFQLQSYTRHT